MEAELNIRHGDSAKGWERAERRPGGDTRLGRGVEPRFSLRNELIIEAVSTQKDVLIRCWGMARSKGADQQLESIYPFAESEIVAY